MAKAKKRSVGVTGGGGDPYVKDAAMRKWFLDYMNSPQYQRMLAESGERGNQDISAIDAMRRSQLASLPRTVFDESVGTGEYRPDKHRITISPMAGEDVSAHELSHVTDLMFTDKTPRLGLPTADMDMIMGMTDPMFREYIPEFVRLKGSKKEFQLPYEPLDAVESRFTGNNREADMRHLMDSIRQQVAAGAITEEKGYEMFMGNASPHEVRARLNAARYMAQKENIYDPFTQTPTIDDVKELLRLYDSDPKKYFQLKWMKAYQSPEQILQLLQSVSDNPNTQQEQYPRA